MSDEVNQFIDPESKRNFDKINLRNVKWIEELRSIEKRELELYNNDRALHWQERGTEIFQVASSTFATGLCYYTGFYSGVFICGGAAVFVFGDKLYVSWVPFRPAPRTNKFLEELVKTVEAYNLIVDRANEIIEIWHAFELGGMIDYDAGKFTGAFRKRHDELHELIRLGERSNWKSDHLLRDLREKYEKRATEIDELLHRVKSRSKKIGLAGVRPQRV